MNVLLCPVGTKGDIHPLTEFGRYLIAAGHKCALSLTTDWASIADELGCPFYPIGVDFRELAEQNSDLMGRPIKSAFSFYKNLQTVMKVQEKVLHDIARNFDVVVGSGLSLAAFNVCEYHKVPYRHIVLSPNWFPSDSYPPVAVVRQFKNHSINRIFWAIHCLLVGMAMRPMNRTRMDRYGMSQVKDFYQHYSNNFILSSDETLNHVTFNIQDVTRIPFLGYSDRVELSPDVARFLKDGDMPVYIGFGSMPQSNNSKLIKRLMRVIGELNLRAVVMTNDVENVDVPKGILQVTSPQPHDKLFPLVRLIIHHGGAGTFYSAAKAGTPQIVMPHLLDQYYWGKRVHELGIGPDPVTILNPSGSKLRGSINEAVMDSKYKERALQVATLLSSKKTAPHGELENMLLRAISA